MARSVIPPTLFRIALNIFKCPSGRRHLQSRGGKQDQRTRTEFQNDRVSTLGPRNPLGPLHIGHQEVISRASVTLIGESFERNRKRKREKKRKGGGKAH